MGVLDSTLRRDLEDACVRGRRAAEGACRAALESLGVSEDRPPLHLAAEKRVLRRGLRAKARQLGDVGGSIALLVGECAYEQWHRRLFARFLAENGLLVHPDLNAPVTLAECDELAGEMGEPDGWGVAARFAAEILPGIFRLDDPCVRLQLSPEGRLELEQIVGRLPADVFAANDALGWVYQFWQRDKKEEINASERKIEGADLGPVTQLFTENYMVRFLLENSLGAWWASRHPDSPLVGDWSYLRFGDDGAPAAGSFEQWPDRIAEVTLMDPCCGSGHFLVEAFSMLWQMRVEEDGLQPLAAQDAVLRENLFGLELDPRCVQIAMFAVALQAWKAGGGWRELPVPNIACSGIPVKAPVHEWTALGRGDERLEKALSRLHVLFRDADTLGSLTDPRRVVELIDPAGLQASFEDVDWDELVPLVSTALSREDNDPATAVLGSDARGIAKAAELLARHYTLMATNPPFLSKGKQGDLLRRTAARISPDTAGDLAITMPGSWMSRASMLALVTPQNWQEKSTYEDFRRRLLGTWSYLLFARCGNNVWQNQSGRQPFKIPTVLSILENSPPSDAQLCCIDIGNGPIREKPHLLQNASIVTVQQAGQLCNPEARILGIEIDPGTPLLGDVADCLQGTSTGDTPRYVMQFWELPRVEFPWRLWLSSSETLKQFDGREAIVRWDGEQGVKSEPGSAIRGEDAWNRLGVSVTQMGNLCPSLYEGERFDTNAAAIIPKQQEDRVAIWCFVSSNEFVPLVRALVSSTQVTNGALSLIPFDIKLWRRVAEEQFPHGLPLPSSHDPTQWLFDGRPEVATEALQVAVARLLGYRWPEQVDSDDLDVFADGDGIVCVPSVLGERPAADRLRELLAKAFGVTWSPAKSGELLSESGSKKTDLESWLRDDFFGAHCKLFRHRPFVWHIWDGRSDGFGALVNYHRLDGAMLQRLTFTYLGDWIERQIGGVHEEAPGAEERLAAAQELQRRLRLILEGRPPYDIYVRWKSLAQQSVGWEPDRNDGVRLNVRPFVKAEVLRSKFNVKWGKDRGRDRDGSERHNELHYTRAEKEAARRSPER